MKRQRLYIAIGATGLMHWMIACRQDDSARGAEAAGVITVAPLSVGVETVRARSVRRHIPVVGTLFAAEEAVISTKASGVLRRTFVDVGRSVRPGDPLAQVDPRDYETSVEQARSSLAEVLARLGVSEVPDESFDLNRVAAVERAAAQLENARFSHDRLVQTEATYSEQELNDVRTRLRVAEADHQLAIDETAALAAAARERRSLLHRAEQRLSETTTTTPPIPTTLGAEGAEEWVVAARLVTEGQYVNVGDPLYRLLIGSPLKLRSKVPERYAGQVGVGQQIELTVVEGASPPKSVITRVSPSVDPANRTFEIEALIDNSSRSLKPGAFGKGVIIADDSAQALFVPVTAIVFDGGAPHVFVAIEGAAHRRSVRIGRREGDQVEIASGLEAGMQIVSQGGSALTDGAVVEVRPAS